VTSCESTGVSTLSDLVDGNAGAPALIAAEDGAARSYEQLAAEVDELAGRLRSAGAGRGERVALVVPDGPQFVRLLLAVTAAGAAAAPLNPAYTADEYAFYLEDLAPSLVLVGDDAASAIRTAADGRSKLLSVDEFTGLPVTSYERAGPDDVALVLHTSGTTSRPKQVPLLQRNLVASARGLAEFYGLGSDDVSFCAMPLFHVHGLVASVLATFATGGTVVVPARFTPRRFWRHARDHAVTWVSAGPTLHGMILDKQEGEPPESLRFVRSCSSALSASLFARCEEAYGVPIVEAYGMTEASHQMASNPLPPRTRKVDSVGVPSNGVEIRIVDGAGADVEIGEVAIRGPGVTPGYVSNPAANAESFFDGWFRTGDRGRFDTGGYLVLEGRIKELIIRGGENISPFEVEAALLAHPAVADAVAFGIADEAYGEQVGAAVALSGDAAEAELRSWCAERLAGFKVPKTVFVLDEIPRTPTGKVQRRRIGEQLTSGS
jgi:acyl-CoA synthetase (AMP-forming)/AMP-acid ligase II